MKTIPVIWLLATSLLTASLSCQASVGLYGTACTLVTPIQTQTPAMGYTGLPQLGTTFALTYSGPNYTFNNAQQSAQPFLALGLQSVAVPLPPLNLIYQPSGCSAYTVALALLPMPAHSTLPEYESSFAIVIPNDPTLINFQFEAQWLLVHMQCGFAGCGLSALATSDAAICTVGM